MDPVNSNSPQLGTVGPTEVIGHFLFISPLAIQIKF